MIAIRDSMRVDFLAIATVLVWGSFITGCSDEPPPEEPNACAHIESGQATEVEFVVRNAASTPRYYATKCDSPFRVLSPKGGYAPANPNVLLCDTAPANCNLSCSDVGLTSLAGNTSQSFVWNGVVYMPVDAAAESCTAANAGDFCFSYCARRQDGDTGKYNLTVRLYEEDLTLTEWKTTFSYPGQTQVTVEIP